MSRLLIHPAGETGKIHDITPASAGWGYVGFGLYRLKAGERAAEQTSLQQSSAALRTSVTLAAFRVSARFAEIDASEWATVVRASASVFSRSSIRREISSRARVSVARK